MDIPIPSNTLTLVCDKYTFLAIVQAIAVHVGFSLHCLTAIATCSPSCGIL